MSRGSAKIDAKFTEIEIMSNANTYLIAPSGSLECKLITRGIFWPIQCN